MDFDPDNSTLDEKAGYAVGLLGLYFQLFLGIPLILQLFLFPVYCAEYSLRLVLWFA